MGKYAFRALSDATCSGKGLIEHVIAEAQAEKVAHRSFNTGSSFAIPVRAKHQFLEMVGFIRSDGDPDVREHPGAGIIHQRERVSCGNGPRVRITTRAVVTGKTLLHIVVRFGKPGKHALRGA